MRVQVRGKKHQHYQGTVDFHSDRWMSPLMALWGLFVDNSKHKNGRILKCCALQVTIIIFLSVVGALLLYMLFLLLVDPLIRKPDPLAQTLHNEEDSEVTAVLYAHLFQAGFKVLVLNQYLCLLTLRKYIHK